MKLYSYFRSSAAYRVRIALNLKGLAVRVRADASSARWRATTEARVSRAESGRHRADVSSTATTCSRSRSRSSNIWKRRIPSRRCCRARHWIARSFVRSRFRLRARFIRSNNLRVLKYLKHTLSVGDEAKDAWYRHWVESGFESLEKRLANDSRVGKLCFGDTPTLADLCLVPQVFNARRFKIDMSRYPTIERIADHAVQIDAFARAAPGQQPDAE